MRSSFRNTMPVPAPSTDSSAPPSYARTELDTLRSRMATHGLTPALDALPALSTMTITPQTAFPSVHQHKLLLGTYRQHAIWMALGVQRSAPATRAAPDLRLYAGAHLHLVRSTELDDVRMLEPFRGLWARSEERRHVTMKHWIEKRRGMLKALAWWYFLGEAVGRGGDLWVPDTVVGYLRAALLALSRTARRGGVEDDGGVGVGVGMPPWAQPWRGRHEGEMDRYGRGMDNRRQLQDLEPERGAGRGGYLPSAPAAKNVSVWTDATPNPPTYRPRKPFRPRHCRTIPDDDEESDVDHKDNDDSDIVYLGTRQLSAPPTTHTSDEKHSASGTQINPCLISDSDSDSDSGAAAAAAATRGLDTNYDAAADADVDAKPPNRTMRMSTPRETQPSPSPALKREEEDPQSYSYSHAYAHFRPLFPSDSHTHSTDSKPAPAPTPTPIKQDSDSPPPLPQGDLLADYNHEQDLYPPQSAPPPTRSVAVPPPLYDDLRNMFDEEARLQRELSGLKRRGEELREGLGRVKRRILGRVGDLKWKPVTMPGEAEAEAVIETEHILMGTQDGNDVYAYIIPWSTKRIRMYVEMGSHGFKAANMTETATINMRQPFAAIEASGNGTVTGTRALSGYLTAAFILKGQTKSSPLEIRRECRHNLTRAVRAVKKEWIGRGRRLRQTDTDMDMDMERFVTPSPKATEKTRAGVNYQSGTAMPTPTPAPYLDLEPESLTPSHIKPDPALAELEPFNTASALNATKTQEEPNKQTEPAVSNPIASSCQTPAQSDHTIFQAYFAEMQRIADMRLQQTITSAEIHQAEAKVATLGKQIKVLEKKRTLEIAAAEEGRKHQGLVQRELRDSMDRLEDIKANMTGPQGFELCNMIRDRQERKRKRGAGETE
ncbi:hypothetical protein BDV95DRAFT_671980 [Massariosphaeria phaeospora]|uniref:Uncharacterized protein n=1 Tax=Massariosphaeria phaeospora TaxID=100035 RepID=A0A7C8M5K0_9PLEO|nr:hypothetical protein BDV95DRAFT_671980 [Massariosphaeria phaeospora]